MEEIIIIAKHVKGVIAYTFLSDIQSLQHPVCSQLREKITQVDDNLDSRQ